MKLQNAKTWPIKRSWLKRRTCAEKLGHSQKINGPILFFAASFDLQIDREMPIDWETPYPLKLGHSLNDPILCFAASCDDLKTVKCQSIEKRRILWNAGSSVLQIDREMMPIAWFAASFHLPQPLIFRLTVKCQSWPRNAASSETPHPQKRPILWNSGRPRNIPSCEMPIVRETSYPLKRPFIWDAEQPR